MTVTLHPADLAAWQSALTQLEARRTAARLAADGPRWVDERLGEFLWSTQKAVMDSVRDHRYTAVQACHGPGKSRIASRIAAWWLETHPAGSARVVTTAPTGDQVKAILWSEINNAAATAAATDLPFTGRINETEWKIGNQLVGFGRKPSDYNKHAFQGIHARYVLVILDEACHDDQTDVMTDRGWRRFADLDGTEKLLTMDPITQVTTYRTPARLISYHYTGEMYRYTAKGANFCVTPNHQMFTRSRHGQYGSHHYEWGKEEMQVIAAKHNRYMKKTILWDEEDAKEFEIPECIGRRKRMPPHTVMMDDWMTFLGWYFSEGHLIHQGGQVWGVGISQKDPDVLGEIHDLCLRLGFPAKMYTGQVHIHSMQIGRYLAQFGLNCLEKAIPDYVRMASARQIALFLDAFSRGDGYRKGKGEILYTSSVQLADGLQELILKTGVPSVVHRRPLAGVQSQLATHVATSSVDGYVVTRPFKSSLIKYFPDRVDRIPYDGRVYCAEVPPEHLLFTRRGGYTLWSGNCGIIKHFWTAARAITTGEHCRILAIGNPDDPGSEFAKVCASDKWNVIKISAFDTPNFTGEYVPPEIAEALVGPSYVEDMRTEYGEDSPTYIAKVLGEFPLDADDGVVKLSALRACCAPEPVPRTAEEQLPVHLGVDLGAGGDETVIQERRGMVAGRVWRTHTRDAMHATGLVVQAIRECDASMVKVDVIGIGWGVVGRLQELRSEGKIGAMIVGVNVSEAATAPEKYLRLRSQIWWEVGRRLAEDRAIDLSHLDEAYREKLITQLVAPKYTVDSSGRIVVEPKDDTKRRLGRSPDNADALLLAFYVPAGGAVDALDFLRQMRKGR